MQNNAIHSKSEDHHRISWITLFPRCSCHQTVTRRMPLVDPELLTLAVRMSSSQILWVRITQYIDLCVLFCWSSSVFDVRHCVVCLSFGILLLITSMVSLNVLVWTLIKVCTFWKTCTLKLYLLIENSSLWNLHKNEDIKLVRITLFWNNLLCYLYYICAKYQTLLLIISLCLQ